MLTYFILVTDQKGNLKSSKEISAPTLFEVDEKIKLVLKTKRYKRYERQGYDFRQVEKPAVPPHNVGATYRENCFINTCAFFGLTCMEIIYTRMMIRNIPRDKMPAELLKKYKMVVSAETVKKHCQNVHSKINVSTDAAVVSRF